MRGPEVPEGLDDRRQPLCRAAAAPGNGELAPGRGVEDRPVELLLVPEVIVKGRDVHAGAGSHLPGRGAHEARRVAKLSSAARGCRAGFRAGSPSRGRPTLRLCITSSPSLILRWILVPSDAIVGSAAVSGTLLAVRRGWPRRNLSPSRSGRRPAGRGRLPPDDADLAHARATDPDGALVGRDGGPHWSARPAAAVREDALLLLALDVDAAHRGKGVGRALLAAARAYGAARGRALSRGARARGPVLLSRSSSAPASPSARSSSRWRRRLPETVRRRSAGRLALTPSRPGASLSGWIAALDRETRGFARPRDWARWAEEGHVVSLEARRPARGASARGTPGPRGTALGPIAAKISGGAPRTSFLSSRRAPEESALSLALPAEARALLVAAASLGFRAVATRVLLGESEARRPPPLCRRRGPLLLKGRAEAASLLPRTG